MENTVFTMWLLCLIVIAVFILIIVFRQFKGIKPSESKLVDIKVKVTKINRQLLEKGLDYEQILDFWEECFAEAQIQHQLPPCTCNDVNECVTWCRVKARFVMNPPVN